MRVTVEIRVPTGPTASTRELQAVPRVGEMIETGNGEFVVSEVRWQLSGVPRVIAGPKA